MAIMIIVYFVAFQLDLVDAQTVDCLMCHEQLAKEKTVHAALQMGCATCHSAIDAGNIPHKKTGAIVKGLSADQPDLCYGCHDKGKFQKKTTHAAVSMGCTGCHNPHSSKYEKLLKSELPGVCFTCHDKNKFENKTIHAPVAGGMCTSCHNPHSSDSGKLLLSEIPDLCFNCHDKSIFSKKNVHAPVMGGMCMSCHSPHATEEMALLPKRPMAVCLDCHPDIPKKRHVVAGDRHPLGSLTKPDGKEVKGKQKKSGPIMDPVRGGKEFYCGGCHDPHSADWNRLMRYRAASPFELCINCHKK